MLWLVIDDLDGASFTIPVKTFVSSPLDVAEFSYHNQGFKVPVLPASSEVEIVVECDFHSEQFQRILRWWEKLKGPAVDYKYDGLIVYSSDAGEFGKPVAERQVYGLWPSIISPDASTLRVTVTFVCDLVGKEQGPNPISFVEDVSEEQKVEIEQQLTPKGLATLARYGVQLVGDQ